MTIWQVAAGDGTRDYSDIFLRYGVILAGPGSEGNYLENRKIYNDPTDDSFRSFLRPLAEIVRVGDRVVLKRPSGSDWEVVAVGEVTSEYEYHSVFEDVDGWDLQHCRMVAWKVPPKPLKVPGLRRGTLVRVNNASSIAQIEHLWSSGVAVERHPIPAEPATISVEELIDSLIEEGLPANTAETITSTIWRLKRTAKWYSGHGDSVGEHEIRTFLIVPLLTSLGWAEQRIRIEWRKIDITIFDRPYSDSARPLVIIESKRHRDGLRYAPEQARTYSEEYPSCRAFLISDGTRYKLFRRTKDNWIFSAYMNLLSLKRDYPFDKKVEGACGFFVHLLAREAI